MTSTSGSTSILPQIEQNNYVGGSRGELEERSQLNFAASNYYTGNPTSGDLQETRPREESPVGLEVKTRRTSNSNKNILRQQLEQLRQAGESIRFRLGLPPGISVSSKALLAVNRFKRLSSRKSCTSKELGEEEDEDDDDIRPARDSAAEAIIGVKGEEQDQQIVLQEEALYNFPPSSLNLNQEDEVLEEAQKTGGARTTAAQKLTAQLHKDDRDTTLDIRGTASSPGLRRLDLNKTASPHNNNFLYRDRLTPLEQGSLSSRGIGQAMQPTGSSASNMPPKTWFQSDVGLGPLIPKEKGKNAPGGVIFVSGAPQPPRKKGVGATGSTPPQSPRAHHDSDAARRPREPLKIHPGVMANKQAGSVPPRLKRAVLHKDPSKPQRKVENVEEKLFSAPPNVEQVEAVEEIPVLFPDSYENLMNEEDNVASHAATTGSPAAIKKPSQSVVPKPASPPPQQRAAAASSPNAPSSSTQRKVSFVTPKSARPPGGGGGASTAAASTTTTATPSTTTSTRPGVVTFSRSATAPAKTKAKAVTTSSKVPVAIRGRGMQPGATSTARSPGGGPTSVSATRQMPTTMVQGEYMVKPKVSRTSASYEAFVEIERTAPAAAPPTLPPAGVPDKAKAAETYSPAEQEEEDGPVPAPTSTGGAEVSSTTAPVTSITVPVPRKKKEQQNMVYGFARSGVSTTSNVSTALGNIKPTANPTVPPTPVKTQESQQKQFIQSPSGMTNGLENSSPDVSLSPAARGGRGTTSGENSRSQKTRSGSNSNSIVQDEYSGMPRMSVEGYVESGLRERGSSIGTNATNSKNNSVVQDGYSGMPRMSIEGYVESGLRGSSGGEASAGRGQDADDYESDDLVRNTFIQQGYTAEPKMEVEKYMASNLPGRGTELVDAIKQQKADEETFKQEQQRSRSSPGINAAGTTREKAAGVVAVPQVGKCSAPNLQNPNRPNDRGSSLVQGEYTAAARTTSMDLVQLPNTAMTAPSSTRTTAQSIHSRTSAPHTRPTSPASVFHKDGVVNKSIAANKPGGMNSAATGNISPPLSRSASSSSSTSKKARSTSAAVNSRSTSSRQASPVIRSKAKPITTSSLTNSRQPSPNISASKRQVAAQGSSIKPKSSSVPRGVKSTLSSENKAMPPVQDQSKKPVATSIGGGAGGSSSSATPSQQQEVTNVIAHQPQAPIVPEETDPAATSEGRQASHTSAFHLKRLKSRMGSLIALEGATKLARESRGQGSGTSLNGATKKRKSIVNSEMTKAGVPESGRPREAFGGFDLANNTNPSSPSVSSASAAQIVDSPSQLRLIQSAERMEKLVSELVENEEEENLFLERIQDDVDNYDADGISTDAQTTSLLSTPRRQEKTPLGAAIPLVGDTSNASNTSSFPSLFVDAKSGPSSPAQESRTNMVVQNKPLGGHAGQLPEINSKPPQEDDVTFFDPLTPEEHVSQIIDVLRTTLHEVPKDIADTALDEVDKAFAKAQDRLSLAGQGRMDLESLKDELDIVLAILSPEQADKVLQHFAAIAGVPLPQPGGGKQGNQAAAGPAESSKSSDEQQALAEVGKTSATPTTPLPQRQENQQLIQQIAVGPNPAELERVIHRTLANYLPSSDMAAQVMERLLKIADVAVDRMSSMAPPPAEISNVSVMRDEQETTTTSEKSAEKDLTFAQQQEIKQEKNSSQEAVAKMDKKLEEVDHVLKQLDKFMKGEDRRTSANIKPSTTEVEQSGLEQQDVDVELSAKSTSTNSAEHQRHTETSSSRKHASSKKFSTTSSSTSHSLILGPAATVRQRSTMFLDDFLGRRSTFVNNRKSLTDQERQKVETQVRESVRFCIQNAAEEAFTAWHRKTSNGNAGTKPHSRSGSPTVQTSRFSQNQKPAEQQTQKQDDFISPEVVEKAKLAIDLDLEEIFDGHNIDRTHAMSMKARTKKLESMRSQLSSRQLVSSRTTAPSSGKNSASLPLPGWLLKYQQAAKSSSNLGTGITGMTNATVPTGRTSNSPEQDFRIVAIGELVTKSVKLALEDAATTTGGGRSDIFVRGIANRLYDTFVFDLERGFSYLDLERGMPSEDMGNTYEMQEHDQSSNYCVDDAVNQQINSARLLEFENEQTQRNFLAMADQQGEDDHLNINYNRGLDSRYYNRQLQKSLARDERFSIDRKRGDNDLLFAYNGTGAGTTTTAPPMLNQQNSLLPLFQDDDEGLEYENFLHLRGRSPTVKEGRNKERGGPVPASSTVVGAGRSVKTNRGSSVLDWPTRTTGINGVATVTSPGAGGKNGHYYRIVPEFTIENNEESSRGSRLYSTYLEDRNSQEGQPLLQQDRTTTAAAATRQSGRAPVGPSGGVVAPAAQHSAPSASALQPFQQKYKEKLQHSRELFASVFDDPATFKKSPNNGVPDLVVRLTETENDMSYRAKGTSQNIAALKLLHEAMQKDSYTRLSSRRSSNLFSAAQGDGYEENMLLVLPEIRQSSSGAGNAAVGGNKRPRGTTQKLQALKELHDNLHREATSTTTREDVDSIGEEEDVDLRNSANAAPANDAQNKESGSQSGSLTARNRSFKEQQHSPTVDEQEQAAKIERLRPADLKEREDHVGSPLHMTRTTLDAEEEIGQLSDQSFQAWTSFFKVFLYFSVLIFLLFAVETFSFISTPSTASSRFSSSTGLLFRDYSTAAASKRAKEMRKNVLMIKRKNEVKTAAQRGRTQRVANRFWSLITGRKDVSDNSSFSFNSNYESTSLLLNRARRMQMRHAMYDSTTGGAASSQAPEGRDGSSDALFDYQEEFYDYTKNPFYSLEFINPEDYEIAKQLEVQRFMFGDYSTATMTELTAPNYNAAFSARTPSGATTSSGEDEEDLLYPTCKNPLIYRQVSCSPLQFFVGGCLPDLIPDAFGIVPGAQYFLSRFENIFPDVLFMYFSNDMWREWFLARV
ncbi:unnamed protein product [Amoebophrya sp. A120]|nr:unnamed protein product [Amoebophrya sp. A120]|eukprot:GSA120T00025722001.1